MQLPYIQSIDPVLNLLQTKWRSQLNPILAIPMLDGLQLTDVRLVTGVNVINHKLGRKQIGWIVTDTNANEGVYRTEPLNDVNLTLTATGNVTVSLWVY